MQALFGSPARRGKKMQFPGDIGRLILNKILCLQTAFKSIILPSKQDPAV